MKHLFPLPYSHRTLITLRGRDLPFSFWATQNEIVRYAAAFGASPFNASPMTNQLQLPPPCPHRTLTASRGRDLPLALKRVKTAYPFTRPRLGHQPLTLETFELWTIAAISDVSTATTCAILPIPSDEIRCLPLCCCPSTTRSDRPGLLHEGDTSRFYHRPKRYQGRYQGSTKRYRQAVPGDTRRYQHPKKAVPARYHPVWRYRPGITFSPVPPRRYPVLLFKQGDTGAIRAAGTVRTGIASIILTSLTANAVHEVKPQSLMKWLWLYSHIRALAILSRIKRGAVVNQNEGVVFAVTNEQGVVVNFAQQGPKHGFYFESIQMAFPDAIIWHKGIHYRVEFEYKARSFVHHQHDTRACDLIICWQNDYPDSILPVLALSDPSWPNTPLALPDTLTRELTYWRERALVLERQLNRHWHSCPQAPLAKAVRPRPMQTGMANQQATILALHAQGLTEREIGLQLYGQSDEPTRTWIRFVLERRGRKDEISRGIHRSDLYPFSPERPPTPEEQAHIHELHALGFSRNRICHTVYGFKNGKVYGWIIDTLAEFEAEDEEEAEPIEHIIA